MVSKYALSALTAGLVVTGILIALVIGRLLGKVPPFI